jgi:KaiC/GvpD/RAD55 family RecA-like ATPase
MITRETFLEYLGLGWSVFPVTFSRNASGKVEKKPLVAWKKYQSELATGEEVEEWMKLKPMGIGLATGEVSRVVVVDVDDVDDPIKLSSPIVVKSAFSGGRHYFYRWTEGLRNTVRMDGMPIDFRGDGGYVVLPPSAYGEKKYEFETRSHPMYLSEMPDSISKMLHKKVHTPLEFDTSLENPYPKVSEGGRNDTAARVAGSLLQKIDINLWDMAAWGSLRQWNIEKCDPPLPEHELKRTFDSVKRAEMIARANGVAAPTQGVVQPMSLGEVAMKRVIERDLEKIAPSTGYPKLDELIRGFVPGHLYTLSGDTNVGKTTICLNFAHRVSAQGKKILYFALEPENTIVDYLASIRTGKTFSELTNDDVLIDDSNISVYSKDQIRKIEDLLAVVRALPRFDLVVVDHIGYFTTAAGKTLDLQADAMKKLAGLAKQKQCAVMVVAHIRKRQSRKAQLHEDDIAGSGAFKQDSTEVLLVVRENEKDETGSEIYTNMGSILVRKTKSGKQGRVVIEFQENGAGILDTEDMARDLFS